MRGNQTRRVFLGNAGMLAAGAIVPGPRSWRPRRPTVVRDKLRLGIIGVAGRGGANLNGVKGELIAGLADIDEKRLGGAAKRFPDAKTFVDYRAMIDELELDAVVVSTPDHSHAPAAALALRKKLDVYCEKPLAHTVAEARKLTELAKQNGRVTQLGTQIHALDNYRRVVELVRAGAVGKVREVWVFCNSKSWSGGDRPKQAQKPPAHVNWDLWLGPAPERPFHKGTYHPANWRRFWDFGGGTIADMACHYMDLAHWALDLRYPTKVAAEGPKPHPETAPRLLAVHYLHPKGPQHDELPVHWYDGGQRPPILAKLGLQRWKNGVLFLGEDDTWLIADYGRRELGPKERFTDFTPPEATIAKSIGHHREWIEACKSRGPTTCNFDYSGALSEAVLLGNVAYRSGDALDWDAAELTVTNSKAAQALVHKKHRKGFKV